MRRLLVAGILLGMVFLSGCVLEDIINDLIGGGTPGGGGNPGIGGVTFVRAIVEYSYTGELQQKGVGPVPWGIAASIGTIGPLVFDVATNTYTATTPIDADPYVQITITFDASGSMIEYLHAFRRMTYGAGGWEKIEQIVAYDIPYDRDEGLSTFWRVDADNVQWTGLELVDYKSWSLSLHTEHDPTYRIVDPLGQQPIFDLDPARTIEIEFQQ